MKAALLTNNRVCFLQTTSSITKYSAFRSIFQDLLAESIVSDKVSSPSKNSSVSLRERDWESLSLSTMSTINTVKTVSSERLLDICNELKAPEGFLKNVGYYLLGQPMKKSILNEKKPSLDANINFVAKIFTHCTSDADLTVVALDDMHHIDNLSWKVIQRLFKIGENILFICGSRPLESCMPTNDDFCKNLSVVQREHDRFLELDIGPLNRFEIAKLAKIILSCKVGEVDNRFVEDIFRHTRGMPLFAAQVLENCKRRGLYGRLDNQKVGWRRNIAEVCHLLSFF